MIHLLNLSNEQKLSILITKCGTS